MISTAIIHRFGDHIDTDVILPGRYLSLRTADELGPHCFEGLDPTFATRVKPGDVIVGGRNFGAGSSREHATIAIKAVGVSCIIATSFARIFYRNAINIGLPAIVCPALVEAASQGDPISIDFAAGTARVGDVQYPFEPMSEMIQQIVELGGLPAFVRRKLAQPGAESQ